MFLGILCLVVWALLATHTPFDTFGWLMLLAAGWFAGFMDSKVFARLDQSRQKALPPGLQPTDDLTDAELFHS